MHDSIIAGTCGGCAPATAANRYEGEMGRKQNARQEGFLNFPAWDLKDKCILSAGEPASLKHIASFVMQAGRAGIILDPLFQS